MVTVGLVTSEVIVKTGGMLTKFPLPAAESVNLLAATATLISFPSALAQISFHVVPLPAMDEPLQSVPTISPNTNVLPTAASDSVKVKVRESPRSVRPLLMALVPSPAVIVTVGGVTSDLTIMVVATPPETVAATLAFPAPSTNLFASA